jgi:hypothetical protein
VGDGYVDNFQRSDIYTTEIESALGNVFRLGIVISHNHKDHKNGIERFNAIVSFINEKRETKRQQPIRTMDVYQGWTGDQR